MLTSEESSRAAAQAAIRAATRKSKIASFADRTITTQDYEPEFFAMGYFTKPKRQLQNYMQPVYIATFKSLGFAKWHEVVIPECFHC